MTQITVIFLKTQNSQKEVRKSTQLHDLSYIILACVRMLRIRWCILRGAHDVTQIPSNQEVINNETRERCF